MEFKAAVSWAVSVAGYLAVQKDEFVTVHCFGGPDAQEQFGWAFASKGVESGWIPQRVLGDPVTQSECICCMDRLATFVGSCRFSSLSIEFSSILYFHLDFAEGQSITI